MINTLKIIKSSWQKPLVGKLADGKKLSANYSQSADLYGFYGSWQVGNCQLDLPTYQLLLNSCFFCFFYTLVVGNRTPLSLRERTPLGVVSTSRAREFCWAAFKNSHLTFLKIFGGSHHDNSNT